MPNVPIFPTIPLPAENVQSLNASVLALKQAVEMLTGQDIDAQRYAAHTFVQSDMPTALHTGDFWICTNQTAPTFNFWNGDKWIVIANMTPVAAEVADFLLHKFAQR